MLYKRLKVLCTIGFIIILGLSSREIQWIPLFMGDLLYAMMVFFIVQWVLIESNKLKIASIALVMTFAIEISQLYQARWINDLRSTFLGRLVLGQGFLWMDLLAYTAGVAMALVLVSRRDLKGLVSHRAKESRS